MELRDYNSGEDLCATDTNLEQGYRLIDLKSFSLFISNVHKCNEGEWICRYQWLSHDIHSNSNMC